MVRAEIHCSVLFMANENEVCELCRIVVAIGRIEVCTILAALQ